MKECCGVVLALQRWRQKIRGRHFKFVADHAAPTHLYYMHDAPNMLTRLGDCLESFLILPSNTSRKNYTLCQIRHPVCSAMFRRVTSSEHRLFLMCCSSNLSWAQSVVMYLIMGYRTTHHNPVHTKYTLIIPVNLV